MAMSTAARAGAENARLFSRMSLFFSNCVYVTARLARRSLPATPPLWLRRALPFLDGNLGTANGAGVVGLYRKYLGDRRPGWPAGLTVLEAGVGATNGSCYELAALGARRVFALEPYVEIDAARDAAQLRAAARAGRPAEQLASGVERVRAAPPELAGGVDCILSNSVLEHVADVETFAREMAGLLAPGGFMLHVVDYRDHFFRYPYHFLQWSRAAWDRWLNPGDLPRWRLRDHGAAFERAGLRVEVILAKPVPGAFERVRAAVHPEFAGYSEAELAIAYGVLFVTRA